METIQLIANVIFQIGLFINAALFLPQALKIFRRHSATGLSLTTFIGFNILQLLTFFHGYFHHDIELMTGIGLSIITCGMVTIGIFMFQQKKETP